MAGSLKKIAVASIDDPRSNKTWSGIPAHMCLELERAGLEVVSCGPLKAVEPSYYRWMRSLFWRSGKGWFLSDVEPKILEQRSSVLAGMLANEPADVLISFHHDPIAAVRPGIPTILVHDATFELLVNYYPEFTGLSRRSIRLGNEAYRRALDHADLAVYSSQWAADSAIRDYNANPRKIRVIEIGANLDREPTHEEVERFVESRLSAETYRFLFLGVDWKRKGGSDAVEIVKNLRRMGISAILDVVGCPMPDGPDLRDFCTEHGFLSKSDSADSKKLRGLFESASFLLVPSRCECYGCVYCEANAFGIPAIGRDTGGVSQIIVEGLNGLLLESDNRNSSELTMTVSELLNDKEKYLSFAKSSRSEFEERLSWGQFVKRLVGLISTEFGLDIT